MQQNQYVTKGGRSERTCCHVPAVPGHHWRLVRRPCLARRLAGAGPRHGAALDAAEQRAKAARTASSLRLPSSARLERRISGRHAGLAGQHLPARQASPGSARTIELHRWRPWGPVLPRSHPSHWPHCAAAGRLHPAHPPARWQGAPTAPSVRRARSWRALALAPRL